MHICHNKLGTICLHIFYVLFGFLIKGIQISAVTLAAYILPKLESGEWKKVLFLPTGALLSKTSFNEGKSVPGIAHAVVLESPAVK